LLENYTLLILQHLLSFNRTNKDFVKKLEISKQLVNYYLKTLQQFQYIEKVSRGGYIITDFGKKYLDRSSTIAPRDQIRLENMCYRYPILAGYENLAGKYEISSQGILNSVTVDNTRIRGVSIRIINSKNPSIIISCSHIFATNLEELQTRAINEANNIARIVEKRWHIMLGEPESAMRPDIAIPSPLAEMALNASGASQIKNDNYIINRSKGRGADIEAHDITHAQKILLIPDTLARIETKLASLTTNYPVLFL